MKLKRIELDGFGKLVGQAYDFSPGLNLIYGRNEAGKSTLQRSIFAALYGFFDAGSITAAKKAAMEAYAPWDTRATFGLKLVFEIDQGAEYKVERVFAPRAETFLYDVKSGKSLNAKFSSSSQGRLFFAEDLLGMPREVFENTSLVRQAELAALERTASAITDAILRLSASASQESTASQAIELLETALKEQIGTQRSRSKPLPEAQHRLEELQAARLRLQNEHQTLSNQMHELAQTEESFEKLQRERDKAEYQRLLAQRQIVRQQRQTIEKTNNEVERCQEKVSQYQDWSKFPADAQPKTQRLLAQHEKAQSDAQQAEHLAHNATQRFSALYNQLDGLRATLGAPRGSKNFPDLETESAETASNILQNWLDEEFSSLRNAIQEKQNKFGENAQNLTELVQIGHEGIAKDRQELGKLETDLAQAKRAVQQIQQAASQASISEDRWEAILANAQTNAEKWRNWSKYPAHLRDEMLQLAAQYNPLYESLAGKSSQIAEAESELAQLHSQINDLQRQVSGLENVRNVAQQERPRIQEIAAQLESARQTVADEQQQFTQIDQNYQNEQQAFDLEKQRLEPLEQLGMAGLNQLQQRWMNATQQLASAQARFVQSKEAWNRVGMPVTEFQRLENTVREIQSGVRPAPKPRRGCRSLLQLKQPVMVDQPPTEITIYSQIQPIYAEFVRQHDEIRTGEGALGLVQDELRQKLGTLAPEVIQENTFAALLQQLQSHQQRGFQIEQRKSLWETRRIQYKQARDRLQHIQTRLEKELHKYGFVAPEMGDALNQFFDACEQKERLIANETALERLQSQVAIVKQRVDQFHAQQRSLTQVEGKIIDLLAKADIQATPDAIPKGTQRYEKGLENYNHWIEAQKYLEQLQRQIDEVRTHLSNARSIASAKEEALADFRRQVDEKYSGLLPDDFTDQHLAQLDADLQVYYNTRSEIEKLQGHLEQLRLQAQNIQQDIDGWAEKKDAVNRLEKEILLAVQSAGIDTTHHSFTEALQSFEASFQGFSNWQAAQRALSAALQAQQAIQGSYSKVEAESASLEMKIAELTKQHPEWKNLTASDNPEIYERNAQKLNGQVLQERDHLTRLQDGVSRGMKNLRHLAELDEEIDLANKEVQQLNSLGQTLELAISELRIATQEFQKIFAPRLEGIVEKGVAHITNVRYRQVKIDPNTLGVRVLSPEVNELVPTEQLSTGTRDLIYLILRMGITQLMSASGEKLPLLLDDPFVEFDAVRQKAALEYLKNLAGQTQILLFTKDDGVKDWFSGESKTAKQCQIIELE